MSVECRCTMNAYHRKIETVREEEGQRKRDRKSERER